VGAVLANVLTIGDGISFTGASTYNGSTAVTIDLKPATDTQLGGIRVLAVGTSGIINGSGTLSLAVATTTQLGAVLVDGTSITATAPGGVITANAGGLSGTTLKSTVVTSSLTSFGASPALTTPAVTTSITTPSTTFELVNTTATTVNFAGAATAIAIGAGTGTTTVNNNLTVTGNFTVNGSTEYLNSTTLQVLDKNIEMGTVATPTDVTADGGGITLKGATDKTITWSSVGWTSSEDFNLVTGKSYEINGAVVLSSTALGSVIVSSSLTSFGASPALTTPSITTSITTPSTTFALVDTTATTINFAGAATALTIGAATAASVYNFATGATISGATKAINIGTSGVSGSTTAISIGSTVSGATSTTTIGGSTFTVSTPGIIDLGTSSTSTTTVTIGGVYDGNILKINGTGAAICGITTGATTGSFSIVNTGLTGELRLAGAATTFNIGHTTTAAQTVNMFTASTATSSYSIATGVTVNGATKSISIGSGGASGSTTSISIGTGGASGSITNITLGSGITSAGTTTVNNSLVASPVEASGTVTIGSLSGTGTITIGQSTQNQTINLANGITATGNTNTINIGSQGTASSTTTVTIGSLGTSSIIVNGTLLAQQATAQIGYRSGSGAGGVQTQGTSRTTAVTLNKITGQITLFAAAGTSTWTTFTVNNTTVVLTDTVIVNVRSGTNTYIALVSAVANNSFNISFSAIVGTASDSPIFNFSVIKGVTS
jgi:hypothetical protein